MISVRIPDEIKKYKEKLLFGLTARQLGAAFVTLLICVPLYFFGRKYLPDDILSWLIILIAAPIASIGFFKFNGMPMELFVRVYFKFEFLFPRKRKFIIENHFRNWQNKAIMEDAPKSVRGKRRLKQTRLLASLERAAILAEREEQGEYGTDVKDDDLATVAVDVLTGGVGGSGGDDGDGKDNKPNKKVKKAKKVSLTLQASAEAIEAKKKNDPNYIPTANEFRLLRQWSIKQEKQRKAERQRMAASAKKKNKLLEKRKVVKTGVPRSTQKTIPFIADYEEGLFEVTPGKFSKVYLMQDINYRTCKEEEQVNIFCKYGEFLNYFPEDMRFALHVDKRIVSKEEQEKSIFYPLTGDSFDGHRNEYNRFLQRQIIAGRNDMQVQKLITVTIEAETAIDALMRFHKIDAEVIENLRKIGAVAKVLSTTERLAYYHDKFRRGREGDFQIDYEFIMKQGISSKDYIAPNFFHFERKHFQMEDEYYRVMYVNNIPSSLSDEFLYELCDNEFPCTVTLSIQPVAQDKGLRIVKKQLTGIEMNKIDAEKRAIRAGYSPETIQHSIKDAHAQAEALYDDMLNKNQKMFFVTFVVMAHGNTLEELEEHCRILEGKARKYTSQLQTLSMQQEEGFKIVLPFGYTPKDVRIERTLTTESTAIFMPFSNQELFQRGGYYYGLNQLSHNLVMINRSLMKTPSGFVLGTSGSGKSFATKRELLNVLLADSETGVLIIDPENEYGDFCRAFGGTVLKVSADSNVHINPMDMPEDYGLDDDDGDDTPLSTKKDKALKKKSDYLMSIIERMISVGGSADSSSITPQQKTIVDRCVRACYKDYLDNNFELQYLPTLLDLQKELDKEKEKSEDARLVAEGVEYYTKGSMDIFAHKTNVDIDNRLVVFNVRDLGDQLRQIALIIVFDFIWNRMVENKSKGVRTYCYCDEIHVMFQSYYAANFLKQLYKRGRKYGMCITGLTQNVEDLLRSEQARGMVSNSDFIMMLNQSSEDLKILASMLNISEMLQGYVTGADAGSGLLFAEKVVVPFVDRFPTDSYLYKLMSTRFGEELSRDDIDKQINMIVSDSIDAAPEDDSAAEQSSP